LTQILCKQFQLLPHRQPVALPLRRPAC